MNSTKVRTPSQSKTRETVDDVYRGMREMILSGEVRGGETLSQVRLAERFSVSRGPVREAMRILQNEGLVETETNHRGRVASFSLSEMEEACSLLLIHVAAAILAKEGSHSMTSHFGSDRLERIHNLTKDVEIAHDDVQKQRAFRDLILLLCEGAGSQTLHIIRGLLDRMVMFRQLHTLDGGEPPYPISQSFEDVRNAAIQTHLRDLAHHMVTKIANLARRAIEFVDESYKPRQLDRYQDMALLAIGVLNADLKSGRSSRPVTIEVTWMDENTPTARIVD